MILADFELPSRIAIPTRMREAARSPEIDVTGVSPLWGASEWLACCHAWPHVDEYWRNDLFLTLSVVSDHEVGDAKSPSPSAHVPRGRLFVIDPLTRHWLHHKDAWRSNRAHSWIGVQWVVARNKAKALARKLVAEHNGRWLPTDDKRYRSWAGETGEIGNG